jgi:hypothetical protein
MGYGRGRKMPPKFSNFETGKDHTIKIDGKKHKPAALGALKGLAGATLANRKESKALAGGGKISKYYKGGGNVITGRD